MTLINTAGVIKTTVAGPLHLRQDADLPEAWVSTTSQWKSRTWDLDNPTNGAKASGSRIIWDIELHNGHNLLDATHGALLDWLRRFVWSLFAAPCGNAVALKPGSAGVVSAGLARLVPWLVENSIRLPKELDRAALDIYRQDLPSLMAASADDLNDDLDDTAIGQSMAYSALSIVYKLWQQRQAFLDCGIEPMPDRPWPEMQGANTLAKEIATEAKGWIQPLPDEIAVPLINRATWFLGTCAEDVIRLQEALMEAYHRPPGAHGNGPGVSTPARSYRQRSACADFSFSVPAGDSVPWHPPLLRKKIDDSSQSSLLRSLQLVKRVQAAAMLDIQWSTGMRASELCGLSAGVDLKTGLPSSVEVRVSASGLNEEFILRGELSKMEEVPREVPWRLGMRPLGSEELPIAVRALLVLDRLLAPYRDLFRTDRLLVSLTSKNGLPKTSDGVGRMTCQQINNLYRDFIAEWVDLSQIPDESEHRIAPGDLVKWRESKGRIITSHQLRKTYAQYVLAVEPRLLPAVKRQFHHMSLAMTERGYWGNNIRQIEPIHAVAAQQTAMLMYELATGRTKVAGKMGVQLEEHIADLSQRLSGMGIERGWREAVRWVRSNGLHITFGAHGGCLPLRPSKMECWKRASERPLGSSAPNYDTREPGVCAGCSCFWMDARHVPFWEIRYVENEVAYREGIARGDEPSFRRIRDRAAQARAFLLHVGADVKLLDQRVHEETNANAT